MTLEQRIVRLERQNRWMKRIGGGAVVLVGLMLTVGQSKPLDIIKARGFIVVDEQGVTRGAFGTVQDKPGLALYEKGVPQTILDSERLMLSGDQPSIGLARDGQVILLNIEPVGPVILLGNENASAMMKVTPQGLAGFQLKSKDSEANITTSPTRSDFSLQTKPDHLRVRLSTDAEVAAPEIKGYEGDIQMGVTPTGKQLTIQGKEGLAGIAVAPINGPNILLGDPDEKMLFKAP